MPSTVILEIIYIGVAAVYTVILFLLLGRILVFRDREHAQTPFVSVVIAARNEAYSISSCLEALRQQDYPSGQFEVIVIDDRSEDGTGEIVQRVQSRMPQLRLLRVDSVPTDFAPKKYALQEGIRYAQGTLILCTDADCRPRRQWIRRMVAAFEAPVGMVMGYSPIQPTQSFSFFQQFAALEGLALGALAWASTAMGYPLTAAGRSLAYRKETFEEVGGFSKIARFVSGDDDLLMHQIKKTKWTFAFCPHPEAQVDTAPPDSLRKLIQQKIRHASKTRYYSGKMIFILMCLYMFNAALALMPLLLILTPAKWPWIAVLWGIKITADGSFLIAAAARFRQMKLMRWYLPVALLHPLYVMILGLLGLFAKFEWKNQFSSTTLGKASP